MIKSYQANSSPVIEFNEVTKDYGNNKIIGPVNFSINKGEVVGFLGPNGSGKTTCIRLILGLIKSTSGSVKVNGFNPVKNHVEALKDVAYSPELPNIQTFFSPRDLLNLVSHEIPQFKNKISRNEEIDRILELVGLQEYSDIKVGKLSKGMIQRVSVAQALIGSPQTLILDEPMIGLDPAGSAHFRKVFQDFAKESQGTVFMSSHIMSEVESLCTSIVIIHRGKILYQGPVKDVTQKVLNYSLIQMETSPLTTKTIKQLEKIPEIIKIETKNSNQSTVYEITIQGNDLDIRPLISEVIVKSGAKLYTIKQGEKMLERAYIEALKDKNGEKS
ncbi:MAG: ABC transporter ATP-binding protein [Candidatus Bathyarchaeota archaeon]|jgi:ABC-2 type transport system ATP-binding protein